jgi:adenylate kinase family enzyme
MDRGVLVPDDVVVDMIKDRLAQKVGRSNVGRGGRSNVGRGGR